MKKLKLEQLSCQRYLNLMLKKFTNLKQFEKFVKNNIVGKKLPTIYNHDGGSGHNIEFMIHGQVVGPNKPDLIIGKTNWEIKAYGNSNTIHIGSSRNLTKNSKKKHTKKCQDKMRNLALFDIEENFVEKNGRYSMTYKCIGAYMYSDIDLKLFNKSICTRKGTGQTKFETRIGINKLINCYDYEVLDIAI